MSVGTAFYPRQQELNAKEAWGEWAGYFAPAVYADFHDIEYNGDPRGGRGDRHQPALQVPRARPRRDAPAGPRDHARRLEDPARPGLSTRRGATRTGKVLDDGTVTRIGRDEYRITAADPCYRWFLMNAHRPRRARSRTSPRSSRRARAAGPSSAAKCSRPPPARTGPTSRYFRHRRTDDRRRRRRASPAPATPATSATSCGSPADGALDVWDASVRGGRRPFGIRPAGIRALDVGAGRGRPDPDRGRVHERPARDQPRAELLPFEIGLGRLVDFGKAAEFNGERALLAEQEAGGPRAGSSAWSWTGPGIEGMFAKHGLAAMISPFVDRAPVPVYKEGSQVGRATSITWGTTIKKMVGFGSLDKKLEKRGHPRERRVLRGGRARQGGRHRRAPAVPGPPAQAHLTRAHLRR